MPWAFLNKQAARGPWGVAIAMVVVVTVAMFLRTQIQSYDCAYCYGETLIHWGSLRWLAATAMTLPIFAHFATGRFAQRSHRMAFWVVIAGHLLFQMICIGYSSEASGGPLPLGVLLAVALPSVAL